MQRAAYAVEEYDTESEAWFTVEVFLTREQAEYACARWSKAYQHRVVVYGPQEEAPA